MPTRHSYVQFDDVLHAVAFAMLFQRLFVGTSLSHSNNRKTFSHSETSGFEKDIPDFCRRHAGWQKVI
eukprot:scaffold1729_cov117-Cylindrotheca_fusiformis.AAC.10